MTSRSRSATQKQLDYIKAYPEVDIVLGWSEEFFDDRPDIRIKRTPLTHEEIVRALRIRNIITHPSVMNSSREAAGGQRIPGNFPAARGLGPVGAPCIGWRSLRDHPVCVGAGAGR